LEPKEARSSLASSMGAGGVPLRVDSRCIDPERTGKRAMSISGIDLIAVAFGAFNVLRLASYFPQIVAVACDRHGATAISFSCWSIWIGANATTALYAWVNLGDLPLAAISAFNAACCTAVLLLAAYKRTAIRSTQWLVAMRRSLPASTPTPIRDGSDGRSALRPGSPVGTARSRP
jgi:hypothetical protein